MLVLGLIVDHGIVIVENSYRLQLAGLSRHEAAIKGVNQVVWPIVAATGTTVAAFLPLMIIPGTIGKFLKVIPLTVTIALIVSTFEALFFLPPSHYAEWGGPRKLKQEKAGKQRFERFIGAYTRALAWTLDRKGGRFLIIALLVTGGIFSLVGAYAKTCSARRITAISILRSPPPHRIYLTVDQQCGISI